MIMRKPITFRTYQNKCNYKQHEDKRLICLHPRTIHNAKTSDKCNELNCPMWGKDWSNLKCKKEKC